MGQIEALIFLLGMAALLAQLARVARVPYPIFLVLGGLTLGFTPGLPTVEIPPEVIFVIFLPPLLNSSAYAFSPLDLRAHLRAITLLSVGLVLLTTLGVAAVAHFVVGLPWAASFVLGAILAPTDPVAAEAIFRRLGVPERVGTVVGGESLINDGTGLVAFRVALVAVTTGTFSLWEAGLDFLLVGGGGILFGLVVARVVLPLWGRLRDPSIQITFSVLIPYGVYICSERLLGVSGILAVVAYGMVQGWRAPRLFANASTRIQAVAFWGVLVFVLEALLFVLVGQQLPSIIGNLGEYAFWQILLYAALVYVALLLTRTAFFFTVPYLHPVFDRLLRSRYGRGTPQEYLVMSWSGMRGGVSLAAALTVPTVVDGQAYEVRDLILFITFAVILATLVLQGLTLPTLINRLRLEGETDTTAELRARLEGARAALDRLERMCAENSLPPQNEQGMRDYYEDRIRRYESGIEAGGVTREYAESSATWRNWRRDLIEAEREAIIRMRDMGEISPETMRRIERDLDLEESRIGG
ncbi:Na+/H+ antiporter [Rubrobacter tropicus]|uniref:Na+/H+ antiporter n=1 Tax=Rubrobacter tropicus TaxID=2653851 RepID=A0A6G8QE54_9ACTN|nr:Na+/H+ antiporter [Rubrobacter tropicus]QIN84785.1 Na+/H+ antiporter [Rubrobacter tropicus]